VRPVAELYSLPAVYLFGSYARDEANEDSDIDFLVDLSGSGISGFAVGNVYNSLETAFDKRIDFVTMDSLCSAKTQRSKPRFIENVIRERKLIYAHDDHK
jgi:predicted nucleotidyltransferase